MKSYAEFKKERSSCTARKNSAFLGIFIHIFTNFLIDKMYNSSVNTQFVWICGHTFRGIRKVYVCEKKMKYGSKYHMEYICHCLRVIQSFTNKNRKFDNNHKLPILETSRN